VPQYSRKIPSVAPVTNSTRSRRGRGRTTITTPISTNTAMLQGWVIAGFISRVNSSTNAGRTTQ